MSTYDEQRIEEQLIEEQLTAFLRRSYRVHLPPRNGDVALDRAAYGTMCRLADDGPQHLAALARAFGLDPSTVTRQVRSLEKDGLAVRNKDPSDRRVVVLDLTPRGRDVLEQVRRERQERLQKMLAHWSRADLEDLGRLMAEFNASMSRLRDY